MQFLLILPLMLILNLGFSQAVTLQISNIDNLNGHLQIALFENQQQFDDEIPSKTYYIDKSGVVNGKKNVKIRLEQGVYGITVLDDEDDSKDMTYRFGIYPLEGVGFSNYKLKGLSKPKFSDFDFNFIDSDLNINIEMKYF